MSAPIKAESNECAGCPDLKNTRWCRKYKMDHREVPRCEDRDGEHEIFKDEEFEKLPDFSERITEGFLMLVD